MGMDKEFNQLDHRSIDDASVAISIRDFDLYYGDFQALKKINLQIPKNRATAFIGPSGCGKSTLLRTFNRMCDFVESVRTEGTIEFCGQDIFKCDANALRVHVGMVFQHPNPFPMSIRDNVLYGPARMKRLSRQEGDAIVEECLTRAAVGRGKGQARQERAGSFGRPAAAPVHRARPGHQPRGPSHGRAHKRP